MKPSTPKTESPGRRPGGIWHRPLGSNPTPAQVAAHHAATQAYWTPERRAAARPIPMPQPPADMPAPDQTPGPLGSFTTLPVPGANYPLAPYQSVGKLYMSIGGTHYVASAFLVGNSVLMTAGHCVFDYTSARFASSISFYPQYQNGSTVGSWSMLDCFIPDAWRTGDHGFDFAFVRLTQPTTLPLLSLAGSIPKAGSSVTSIGYPAEEISGYDFNGKYMWQSASALTTYFNQPTLLGMSNNMTEGCSGGPWVDGQNAVIGVNSFRVPSQLTTMNSPKLGSTAQALYSQAMGLSVEWQFDLNHSGHNDVAVAVASSMVVLGSDGWCYLLDAGTGDLINTNGLDGLGHNDIRLAVRVKDDGELVTFVGTDGYVMALKASDFGTEVWRTELPTTSGTLVNVLWDGTNLFAGCAGHAYWLDPDTGKVNAQNDLSAIGSEEIRLASTATTLFVGSDEYVIGISLASTTSFTETLWNQPLDKADDIVSVLAVGGSVYAGSYGFIYQLDQTTGALQNTNGLSGMGNEEVRFVSDGTNLYAGTNGYIIGIALQSFTSTLWNHPLPSAGSNLVDVALVNGNLLFGCNGYAYQYDTGGNMIAQNNLVGLRHHDVSVASDGYIVAIGTWGWAVGTDLSNFTGTGSSQPAEKLEPA